jgi:glycosyltransferase involved in cell wall biosynthesis
VGRFSGFQNVTKRVVRCGNKAIWDQVLIPLMVLKEKVDVLFNPKFTTPLFVNAKAVMVVHGADWFLPEYSGLYSPLDVFYIKRAMPLYFRRADGIISVSNYSTEGFLGAIPSCARKIKTIYLAPQKIFRPISDHSVLHKTKEKYCLPDQFILTVIHYDSGRKNFGNMLKAYQIAKTSGISHKFVVCGRDVEKYAQDYRLQDMGLEKEVIFKGWVEQEDLPGIYNNADLYLYPTRIEAFPIPISEAMACGCAIVTSRDGAFNEIAGDAAIFVDSENPTEIADGILRVLRDDQLKQDLRVKGIERSKNFSWEKCATETLALFESLQNGAS